MESDRFPVPLRPSLFYPAGYRRGQDTGDDREAELMRLSMEPMHLHAFLCRDPPAAIDRPQVLNLLAFIERTGEGGLLSHTCSPKYIGLEPATGPSLEPETFIPREEDREQAIDCGEKPTLQDVPGKPFVIAALAVGVILLALLLV